MKSYAPRTLSSCCRARVVAQHCSDCHRPAPWRTRLTEEEAEQIAARELAAAQPLAGPQLSRERAQAALYGEAYDD